MNNLISKLKVYKNNVKKAMFMFVMAGSITAASTNFSHDLVDTVIAKDAHDDKDNKENTKWKSLNDKLEYRYVNGVREVRKHTYKKKSYDKETKKDVEECSSCHHTKEVKHTHELGKLKYNKKTKKDVGVCKECGKKVSKKHTHKPGKYKLNKETWMDEAKCKKCGKTLTREHKEKTSSSGGSGSKSSGSGSTYIPTYPSSSGSSSNSSNTSNNNSGINTPVPTPVHKHIFRFSPWEYADEDHEKRECIAHDGVYEYRVGHNYGEYIFNATTGLDESTCATCGHIKTKEHVDEHTHSFEGAVWQYFNEEQERRECVARDGAYEYQGHSYGEYIYNPTNNLEESTCATCGHIKTKSHTHNFDNSSWLYYDNNEERRTCVAGDTYEVRNHTPGVFHYNSDTGLEEAECSTCGHIITKEHTHNFEGSNWIYADENREKRECITHDGVYEYRNGHNYGEYIYNPTNNLEEATCSTCGHIKTREHVHNFDSSNWEYYDNNEERRTCVAGDTYEVRNHTPGVFHYNSDIGLEEATCTTCGHIITKEHVHNFEGSTWEYYDNNEERRTCVAGDTYETRSHTPGEFHYNSDTKLDEAECTTCHHTITKTPVHEYATGWSKLDNETHVHRCTIHTEDEDDYDTSNIGYHSHRDTDVPVLVTNAAGEYEDQYECEYCVDEYGNKETYTVPHVHRPVPKESTAVFYGLDSDICETVDIECSLCHKILEHREIPHDIERMSYSATEDYEFCHNCNNDRTVPKITASPLGNRNLSGLDMSLPVDNTETEEDVEEVSLDSYEEVEPIPPVEVPIEEEEVIEEVEDTEEVIVEEEAEEELYEYQGSTFEEEIEEEDVQHSDGDLETANVTVTQQISYLNSLKDALRECYGSEVTIEKGYVKSL